MIILRIRADSQNCNAIKNGQTTEWRAENKHTNSFIHISRDQIVHRSHDHESVRKRKRDGESLRVRMSVMSRAINAYVPFYRTFHPQFSTRH